MPPESTLLDSIQSIPDFIPTFEESRYRSLVREFLVDLNFNPENSDLAKKLEDTGIYFLYLNYIHLAIFFKNQFPEYAEGIHLDELAKLYGITRKQDLPPMAKAKLKSTKPLYMIAGTQFISKDGKIGFLAADTQVTPEGVEALIQTTEEGDIKLTELIIAQPDFESIEMLEPFTKLSTYESDPEFRSRITASLARFSTAGSGLTYDYYVTSFPGVKQCKSYNDGAGKVKVVYDGDEKLSPLISEYLKDKTPITDSVTVQKAVEVVLDVKLAITFNSKAEDEIIIEAIKSDIIMAVTNLKVGEKIPVSKFYSYVTYNENIYCTEVDSDTLEKIEAVQQNQILKLKDNTITVTKKYRSIGRGD